MIVIMKPRSTDEHVDHVVKLVQDMGGESCVIDSAGRKVVEVLGSTIQCDRVSLENAPLVEKVVTDANPILAAERRPADRTLEVPLGPRAVVGGHKLAVIAGPCSVESQAQLLDTAASLKRAGAVALRGGAFKPRTSPYSFQGHGERGLEMLALAREETGLAVVTEVMCCEQVGLVADYADVLQIGSRNMHNTCLLRAVGRQNKPVLLKRGWSATLNEFLMAAEYIMGSGNQNVILCERGVRTFETHVRNSLVLATVPEVKRVSKLPIVVDPSHGTGKSHLVTPMCRAAIACGADGLLIEVHPTPHNAWTDGDQSLDLDQFRSLMNGLGPLARVCERGLS